MRSRTLTRITALTLFVGAITLFATLAIPDQLAAKPPQHTRYELIDLNRLGGPNGYLESFPPETIINSQGAMVGFADTLAPDHFFPNCFTGDCFVAHAFIWQRGVVTDLGSLAGSGYSSFGSAINARGEVVGASQNGQIDPLTGFPEAPAVLWENGIINLVGTLGGNQSVANAINNGGQVVGSALNAIPDPLSNNFCLTFNFFPAATQAHAFRWTEAKGMQDLGTLGGPDSTAVLVNESGQITGMSYTNATVNPNTGFATLEPFFWENGKMVDIGTLGGTFGYPLYMNNRGQVVGISNLAGDQTNHPFLWDRGSLKDLGTLGGDNGLAEWINDAGEVVGEADLPGSHAHDAFLWKNGVITDLGNLGRTSFAYAINSRGQVVGHSKLADGTFHAFLWEKGGPMVDLNSLVSPSSNITVNEAFNINDRGEIAGLGILANGDQHAILLVPTGE